MRIVWLNDAINLTAESDAERQALNIVYQGLIAPALEKAIVQNVSEEAGVKVR